jgi:hypothetical protein
MKLRKDPNGEPVAISGTWNRNAQTLTWEDPQGKDRTAWGEFNSEQEGTAWFIIHEEKDEEGQLLYTAKAAV